MAFLSIVSPSPLTLHFTFPSLSSRLGRIEASSKE